MNHQVCVFVDGENFRHVICDLFSDFDRRDYLPKTARWAELFDWLVGQADPLAFACEPTGMSSKPSIISRTGFRMPSGILMN